MKPDELAKLEALCEYVPGDGLTAPERERMARWTARELLQDPHWNADRKRAIARCLFDAGAAQRRHLRALCKRFLGKS